jgi:hypothetical protein
MKDKSKKKCTVRTILISFFSLLLIGVICIIAFLEITYKVDNTLVSKNENYNVVLVQSDYTTLAKTDDDGNYLDDDFKIISFTDFHLDVNRKAGNVTVEMLIRNIVSEKPDLVVFVGDNITSVFNTRRTKQLAQIMEELGVYWTCVVGNHEGDNILSISKQKMADIFASYPHCLIENDIKTTSGGETVSGVGNHVINLLDANGDIRQSLYFLDCGEEMSGQDMTKYADEIVDVKINKYDYIKESQIEWYKETVLAINTLAGKTVRSVIFDHVPLTEFGTAYDDLDAQILFGTRLETVCCSGHNSGLFDAIIELGSTQAVISGHDHVNDYAVIYKGVLLAYNQASGYGSYNVITEDLSNKLIQGFSVYTIDKDGGFLMDSYKNADLYPNEQAEILKLYD